MKILSKHSGVNFGISIGVLLVLLGVLTLVAENIGKKQITRNEAATNTGVISLQATGLDAQQQFQVTVMVDPQGNSLAAVDLVLEFPKDQIQLETVQASAQTNSSFKTYVPVVKDANGSSNGTFDTTRVISEANTNGQVALGAVTFDWANSSVTSPVSEVLGATKPFAVLTFKKKTGATATSVVLEAKHATSQTGNATTDSNLVDAQTATDILNPSLAGNIKTTVQLQASTGDLSLQVKFQAVAEGKQVLPMKVTFKQNGQVIKTADNISLTSVGGGKYQGTVTGIPPGTYDLLVKGWAHLQKKKTGVVIGVGANTVDMSGEALKAGDFGNRNVIDISQVSDLLSKYTSLSVPKTSTNQKYDVDCSGALTITDISQVLLNYTQLSVPGEN